jgi:triosephosphate isomerase
MTASKLIVGNWKMNGLAEDSYKRAHQLAVDLNGHKDAGFQMLLCPPATVMGIVSTALKGSAIAWGGQDCHARQSGAFTGDISAEMLRDLGCTHVIVGHSERRQQHKETSADVAAKAKSAHLAGLIPIICVGEQESQRTAGLADEVVSEQLAASIPDTATAANTVLAYEPIWAIGTGKTASPEDIHHMHSLIRGKAGKLPILYGGSVKADNAREILHIPNVDGVLVGGASLKADEFWTIAMASEGK